MEYKRFGNTLLIRLDPGDELLAELKTVCEAEHATFGTVSGLGAVNHVVLGLFDPATKQYTANTFDKNFEIVSIAGNVTRMDGQLYLHLHMAVADAEARVVGGHVNEVAVSATAELVVNLLDGETDRAFSDAIGLNLLKF